MHIFTNNLKHRVWSSFLLPDYLADRLAHIYNTLRCSPPHAKIPRASSSLQYVPQLCISSCAYNLKFCTKEETEIYLSPPLPPKKTNHILCTCKAFDGSQTLDQFTEENREFTSKDWSFKNR